MQLAAVKDVADQLEELRPTAIVVVRPRLLMTTTPMQEINALVETLGFKSIMDKWREIEHNEAADILFRVLERDLAYGVGEMKSDQAENLAKQFLNCFPNDSRYFTNGKFVANGWSGTQVANGTFETGVACVSDNHVGVLWVEDED